ncbi:MAG: VWA domain-containing protein [Planctomycetes bacterium]|nr:VWA domain-containing protein [Planctomycetota bacterium]
MTWERPELLGLIPVAAALILLAARRSQHPMSPRRRAWLCVLRIALFSLAAAALAEPTTEVERSDEAVVFVLDHSRSQGRLGQAAAVARIESLIAALPPETKVGIVSTGEDLQLVRTPASYPKDEPLPVDPAWIESGGAQSNLSQALALASGLFPPNTDRRVVLVTDGLETRGDLRRAAREAALKGIVIDCVPNRGPAEPDARIVRLRSSRARAHEGSTIALYAEVESSLSGTGTIRLFENGVEVESRELTLEVGEAKTVEFKRTPEARNLYRFLVRVEGFEGDQIPENDDAMTLVEVRGRPLLLYVEGLPDEAHFLAEAMAREGIRLDIRPPEGIPESLQQLAAYDGVILSDVPARMLSQRVMAVLHDYVEKLGGGFLMIGGINSFGVGGYYRTPIEDILPVKMQPPDQEERFSTAICLIIDRSGSMQGQKIEICKSAAIATASILSRKDYIGVCAFDSAANWVVPMTRAGNKAQIRGRIATLTAGGGTNIYPGMTAGYEALKRIQAKVKHAIVLTDGRTAGGGYEGLAAQMLADGITVSAVGVGGGADKVLLRGIARAGGGKFYETSDPSTIPRIFTQDTAVHMGRLVREEAFVPQQVERHPMLKGWTASEARPLLGYVKTLRKATTQVPLVTDQGDPLLAHWRFGLGKVTAFTSDCKSRWAALWLAGWPGYGQFWGQVLREMARNPEGQLIDLRLSEVDNRLRVEVDALEDAATFRNAAKVTADVYFVPAGALGSQMKPLIKLTLDPVGPGRYRRDLELDQPGVYLVRTRAGADMASAGYVHEVSGEAAVGRVDFETLRAVAETTGGKVLKVDEVLSPRGDLRTQTLELTPWLLRAILLFMILELIVRRWENLLGVRDTFEDLFGIAPEGGVLGRHAA